MRHDAPKCTRCKSQTALTYDKAAIARHLDDVLAGMRGPGSESVHFRYGYAAGALVSTRVMCETLCLLCAHARREELNAEVFPVDAKLTTP